MILSQPYLLRIAKAQGISSTPSQTILNENSRIYSSSTYKSYDIFLSHSSLDKQLAVALLSLFNMAGYSVYVDWIEDPYLDRSNVTKITARKIQERMECSRGLNYVATSNSSQSKWCPWELGFFDKKSAGRCAILPVMEHEVSIFKGQEYLGLYPYIEYEKMLGKDKYNFWVHEPDTTKYVILSRWLNGVDPFEHE